MIANKLKKSLPQEMGTAVSEAVTVLKEIIEVETKLYKEMPVENLKTADTQVAEKIFQDYKVKYDSYKPELVWEYSTLGNHYQTLLFDNDQTITISVCPNQYVPWALRNAVHPREHDFLVIDGFTIKIANIMEIIDEHLENKNLKEAIINYAVVQLQLSQIKEEENEKYQPTQEQLQNEFDRWRSERGLTTPESYNEYLEATGLTHLKIEAIIKDKRTYNNFLEAQCHTSVKDYFAQHKSDFIRYKIESYSADYDEVDDLNKFLLANPDQLCLWNRNKFLTQKENLSSYQLNECWHYQLDSEVADTLVQNQRIGMMPTFEINNKILFVNVLSIQESKLDIQTETRIRQKLVQQWINEKKKSCSIQWLWGDKDIFQNQNIQEN